MKASKVFKFTGFILLRIGLIILVLFITMTLWNWLIPVLFHGPVITVWQTAGLIVLSKIFFTGIVPGGGGHRHNNRGFDNFHNHEHLSREDWWKRFNDAKKDKESSSTAV